MFCRVAVVQNQSKSALICEIRCSDELRVGIFCFALPLFVSSEGEILNRAIFVLLRVHYNTPRLVLGYDQGGLYSAVCWVPPTRSRTHRNSDSQGRNICCTRSSFPIPSVRLLTALLVLLFPGLSTRTRWVRSLDGAPAMPLLLRAGVWLCRRTLSL